MSEHKSTLSVGISHGERDGRIVAHSEGATFSGLDLRKLPIRKAYIVSFYGHQLPDDSETALIYAVDDATALEWAEAKYIKPFQLTEKITTWREVGDYA